MTRKPVGICRNEQHLGAVQSFSRMLVEAGLPPTGRGLKDHHAPLQYYSSRRVPSRQRRESLRLGSVTLTHSAPVHGNLVCRWPHGLIPVQSCSPLFYLNFLVYHTFTSRYAYSSNIGTESFVIEIWRKDAWGPFLSIRTMCSRVARLFIHLERKYALIWHYCIYFIPLGTHYQPISKILKSNTQ